jgi:hypothetical protein
LALRPSGLSIDFINTSVPFPINRIASWQASSPDRALELLPPEQLVARVRTRAIAITFDLIGNLFILIPRAYAQDRQDRQDRHHLLGDNLGDVGGLTPIVLKVRRCARWNTRGVANAFTPNFAPIPIDAGGV